MGDNNQIVVVNYNPEWVTAFRLAKTQLRRALGNIPSSIDHIGSTAVPGLRAKPVIDILVSVSEIAGEAKLKMDQALNMHGLPQTSAFKDHRPHGDANSDEHWQKLFFKWQPPEPGYMCHIHIRKTGFANWGYALLFRDFLRAHRNAALAYGDFKDKLAAHLAHDRDAYTDIKDPVCDIIMLEANTWADRVGWHAQLEDVAPPKY